MADYLPRSLAIEQVERKVALLGAKFNNTSVSWTNGWCPSASRKFARVRRGVLCHTPNIDHVVSKTMQRHSVIQTHAVYLTFERGRWEVNGFTVFEVVAFHRFGKIDGNVDYVITSCLQLCIRYKTFKFMYLGIASENVGIHDPRGRLWRCIKTAPWVSAIFLISFSWQQFC